MIESMCCKPCRLACHSFPHRSSLRCPAHTHARSRGAQVCAGRDDPAQLQGLPRRGVRLGPGLLRVGGVAGSRGRQVRAQLPSPPCSLPLPPCCSAGCGILCGLRGLPVQPVAGWHLLSCTAGPQLTAAGSCHCLSPHHLPLSRPTLPAPPLLVSSAPAARCSWARTRCFTTCWWTRATGRLVGTTRLWRTSLRSC